MNIRGEILSAVAHEVHQPLFAIKNFALAAKAMLSRSATVGAAIELLDEIAEQAERGSEIGRRLRDFARHAIIERDDLSMHEVIRNCRGIAELHASQSGVKLILDLNAAQDRIAGDGLQLQHVLLNLVKNSCEAMSETPREQRTLTISTVDQDGEILVRIADRGMGISAGMESSLFEPYRSSKSFGMGIGLAVCRTIISAHEGRIWHEPTSTGGTVFAFSIALAEPI